MTTRGEWARAFLIALGNPSPDEKTVNFVAAWTLGENTTARYNPLATTQPMPGSACFNCPLANVQNYTSHQQGIDASVKTLTNGRYPHILEGLKTNDPEQAVNGAELGTWGTGLGFTTLWRTGDHRGETLLSHRPIGEIADKIEGASDAKLEQPSIGGAVEGAVSDAIGLPSLPSPDAIARNVTFIALGGALLFVSIILAVRTFVPVQQIVKTVAAVA